MPDTAYGTSQYCLQTCSQTSDCADPATACVGNTCLPNYCVRTATGSSAPGTYDQACDAAGTNDGTCLQQGTETIGGGGLYGLCYQSGSSPLGGNCSLFVAGDTCVQGAQCYSDTCTQVCDPEGTLTAPCPGGEICTGVTGEPNAGICTSFCTGYGQTPPNAGRPCCDGLAFDDDPDFTYTLECLDASQVSCGATTCANGYSCDATSQTCCGGTGGVVCATDADCCADQGLICLPNLNNSNLSCQPAPYCAGYGSSCDAAQPCCEGYACDPYYGECELAPGAACNDVVSSCVSNWECDGTRCIPWTEAWVCPPGGGNGVECSDEFPCCPGYTCESSTCQPSPTTSCSGYGAACSASDLCCDGLMCDPATSLCYDAPWTSCTGGSSCADGYVCTGGQCVIAQCGSYGQDCSLGHPCCDDLACDPASSTCRVAPEGNCASESCATGWTCTNDTCTCGGAGALCGAVGDAPCCAGSICQSGNCQ